MYKKDTLFRVIHSMTEEEKKNFYGGIAYAKERDKAYVALFEILNKQEVYDEQAANRDLIKKSGAKNFAKVKLYLLELLFDNIYKCGHSQDINLQIVRMLSLADTFFKRSEYGLCQIFVSKANKQISESESFQQLTWYSQINIKLFKKGIISHEEVLQYTNEYNEYKKKMDNISDYIILELNSFLISKRNANNNDKLIAGYKKIIETPYLQGIENCKTISSKIVYYNIHRVHARLTKNYQAHFKYTKELVEFYQANPEFTKYYIFHYLSALANLGDASLLINDYATFNQVNQLIDGHKDTDLKNSNKAVVLYTYHAKFIKLRKQAKYSEGLALLDEFHQFSRKSGVEMYNEIEIVFLLHTIIFYFANQEFRKMQIMLNRLGVLVSKKENETFFILHKILELVKVYEQNDLSLCQSKFRSVERYMDLYAYKEEHKLIMDCLKESVNLKLSTNDSEKVQRHLFADLAHKLQGLMDNTYHYEEFPFSYWAKAKASGINLIDYSSKVEEDVFA